MEEAGEIKAHRYKHKERRDVKKSKKQENKGGGVKQVVKLLDRKYGTQQD